MDHPDRSPGRIDAGPLAEHSCSSSVTRCQEAIFVAGSIGGRSRSDSGSCRGTGRRRPSRSHARILSIDQRQDPQSRS